MDAVTIAALANDIKTLDVALELLLVQAGADTSIADQDGMTALDHARKRDFNEIATLLE